MNTTQASIQNIQTRLQALGQPNRRVVPSSAPARQSSSMPPSQQPISLPPARPLVGDRPALNQPPKPIPHSPSTSSAESHLFLEPPTYSQGSERTQAPASSVTQDSQHQALESPFQQVSSAESVLNSTSDSVDAAFQQLDVQVQHVNSMSQALEAALQEIATAAQHLNQQRIQAAAKGQRTCFDHLDAPLVYDPQRINPEQTYLPQIERSNRGEFVITGRPLTWEKNAQEAPSSDSVLNSSQPQEGRAIATHLRHQRTARKPHSSAGVSTFLAAIVRWFNPSHGAATDTTYTAQTKASPGARPRHNQLPSASATTFATPAAPTFSHPHRNPKQRSSQETSSAGSSTIPATLLLIGGSAIARKGMDELLVMYPMLWPLVIALVVTPAAIAIYRSTVDPDSSFTLGRRLLFVMIGLLLGGRL